MNKMQISLIENYMLSCLRDSAHDKEHIYRVLYTALEIARSEDNVDYDVLIASCLLHDIARAEQFDDPKVCHAAAGGEKAYHFLVEHGFSISFAEKVKHCIQTHRFRKNNEPQMIQPLHSFRNISTSSKMYIQNFIPGKGKNLHGKEKT